VRINLLQQKRAPGTVAPGKHAPQTESETVVHKCLRELRAARKIMQDSARRCPFLSEKLQHLIKSAPAMQDHRKLQFPGNAQLAAKDRQLALQGKYRSFAVQPYFTNCHRF